MVHNCSSGGRPIPHTNISDIGVVTSPYPDAILFNLVPLGREQEVRRAASHPLES
jgi:hypothetical protein